MSIDRKLEEFETIVCPKCRQSELELHNTLWCCYYCGNKIGQYEINSRKKYISKIKLKKYILEQFDENLSKKIIVVYLKKEGYAKETLNNERLIKELFTDLTTNTNFETHKLFNLNNVIIINN
jgi:ribosomal protein L37AE/L43A